MKRQTWIDLISALFILLFVYTAINKFLAIEDLKEMLKKYPLIGGAPMFIAWALPLTEIIIASFLFIPKLRLFGLYGSLGLMSAFTLYVSYMLIFTPKLPCSCGGMLQQLTWPQHLIFNFIFVFLAVTGIWLHKRQYNNNLVNKPASIVFT